MWVSREERLTEENKVDRHYHEIAGGSGCPPGGKGKWSPYGIRVWEAHNGWKSKPQKR